MSPMSDSFVVSLADITGHRRLHINPFYFSETSWIIGRLWWKEQRWKKLESEGRGNDRNNSNVERAGHVSDHVCSGHLEQGSNHYTEEVAPQIAVEKTDVKRIEEGSDEESEEEEKRTWKRSRVEMEDMRQVVIRHMLRMPSDDD